MPNLMTRNAKDVPTEVGAVTERTEFMVIEPLYGMDTVVSRYDALVAVAREVQPSARDAMPADLGTPLHLAGGPNMLLPLVSFETVAEALETHYGHLAITELFHYTGDASPSYIRLSAISGWSTMRGCGGVYLQSGQTLGIPDNLRRLAEAVSLVAPVRVKQQQLMEPGSRAAWRNLGSL